MDYSNYGNAPTEQGGTGELIPDGTLAWAIVTVRPHNLDHGMVLVPSKATEGNKYLDVELTICDGQYTRRKVWDMIGLAGSEKWVMGGMAAVRHIIEVGREMTEFRPDDPRYRLGKPGDQGDMPLMDLNEMRCAIRVGVEPGKDGYPDKNRVRAYLSPNPASDTHKTFVKLTEGVTMVEPRAAKPAAAAGAAWGAGQKPATAASPTWASKPGAASDARPAAPAGRPAWAGQAPNQAKVDDKDIPF